MGETKSEAKQWGCSDNFAMIAKIYHSENFAMFAEFSLCNSKFFFKILK